MAQFDRHWIRARLSGKRGEQSALARAMGIDPDKMSKIMRGERQIKASEIPGLLEFFNVPFREAIAGTPPGFGESDAAPFTPAPGDGSKHLLAAFLGAERAPEVFEARAPAPAFAVLAGDLLAVEMSAEATPGDLVLATIADPETGEAGTLLRRYQPPWLLSGTLPPGPAGRIDSDDGTAAIMGIVRAVLRRT